MRVVAVSAGITSVAPYMKGGKSGSSLDSRKGEGPGKVELELGLADKPAEEGENEGEEEELVEFEVIADPHAWAKSSTRPASSRCRLPGPAWAGRSRRTMSSSQPAEPSMAQY